VFILEQLCPYWNSCVHILEQFSPCVILSFLASVSSSDDEEEDKDNERERLDTWLDDMWLEVTWPTVSVILEVLLADNQTLPPM
jgi:hypothetical protein